MANTRTPSSGNWTSSQAYVISVICLIAGFAIGYVARRSGSAHAAVPSQTLQASAVPAGMGTGVQPSAGPPAPTAEQLRQMADTQAEPLLAQLKSTPNDVDLLYKIGNLYYDAQQYPEAVKFYENCLKINPKATDVRTDMATAYHFMGESDRALKEYNEVLKVDSKHANALFNEGMVKWEDKKDVNGAIAAWKRLLETNPDYPQRDRVQSLIAQAEQHMNLKPVSAEKLN
jgi:cytochrome c-type biogenesis protein CcmH/NrfG